MAFSRTAAVATRPGDAALTAAMAGIGFNFAVNPDADANIEDTLVFASELGMDEADLRVLAVLTAWLGVHSAHVNADRLIRTVSVHPSPRVRGYWSAVGQWLIKDRRFARLTHAYEGPPIELLSVGTEFQIGRHGEDPRFAGSALRVPAGTLRDRPDDVVAPAALARLHPGYRNRIQMGPSWRADVWTELEREPDQSIAELARVVGCSFATAWQVTQDFTLLRRAATSDVPTSARA